MFGLSSETVTFTVVASIEETANRYHIPKPFIGLILLPIVVRIAPVPDFSDLMDYHSSGKRR